MNKNKYSRERTAIEEFKKLLPGLNSYAKAVAGKDLKVLLGTSNQTDGTNIYIRPPMELADQSRHDRNYCGQRADNGLLICDGCHVRESVLGGVHHEIAHLVHGSYTKFPNTMVQSILGESIEEYLGKQARRNFNKAMLQDREYVWVGEWSYGVAPELPGWVLALEDVRVNAASYKALAGLRAMQFSRYSQVLINGIEQEDGTYYRHTKADADMQVNIAVLFAAQGFEVRGWLADDIVDTIELPEIAALIAQCSTLNNPLESVELSCKFIHELRKLGYYGEPEPEAFPLPMPSEDNEEEQGDPGDSGSDAGDSGSDDSGNDPADDGEEGTSDGEAGAEDGSAGDAPQGGDESEDADDSPEGGDESADAEGTPGDPGSDDSAAGADEDRGDGSSDDGDPEGGGGEGEPSGDSDRAGSDGAESGSDAGDSGEVEPSEGAAEGAGSGAPESPGADDEHVRDEDARGAGGDEQSPDAGESDSTGADADGPGSSDSGEGDVGSDSDPASEGDSDEGDAVRGASDDGAGTDNGGLRSDPGPSDEDGDDTAGDEADQDGDQPGADDVASDGEEAEQEDHGEPGPAYSDAGADGDDSTDSGDQPAEGSDEAGYDQFDAGTQGSGDISGPALEDSTATGVGSGDSAGPGPGAERTVAPRPTSGLDTRLDNLMTALATLLGHAMMENEHGHEPSQVCNGNDTDEQEGGGPGGESDYVTHKMISQDDLEKVINCLAFLDNISPNLGAPSVRREHQASKGRVPQLTVPGEVNRATYKARLIFAENRRVERHRNQKSGRIKGSILGRRVPVQDVRLFERKTQPDKRDWETMIMLDRSYSTQGDVAVRIRQTAFAIAEVQDRIDVPFSIWTSSTEDIGMWDYGPRWDEIKSVKSHWDRAAQQRLGGAHPISGNLDGHTMQFCRKQLQQSRATDKLLLYFTDGEMPASNYEEELELLQQEIKLMRKLNIHVVGVGMGTDSPRAHGLDTVRVDGPADIGLVIDHLSKVLK